MKDSLISPSLLNGQGKTFNLKPMLPLLVATVIGGFGICANGQDITLDKIYHPDEPIHVVITFAGRVDLSNAGVEFDLVKLDNQAQNQWTRSFTFGQLKPLGPNEYEASGMIPTYAATGTYRLNRAWSSVSDLSKNYNYPDTLHQDITVRVINGKPDPLPALIDLKLVK